MSYDVITHEKLDAVISELKAIRSVLEVQAADAVQVEQKPIDVEKMMEVFSKDVVKKAGKKKETE